MRLLALCRFSDLWCLSALCFLRGLSIFVEAVEGSATPGRASNPDEWISSGVATRHLKPALLAAVLAFATVLWHPGWPMTFPLSGIQSEHSINGEEEDVCEEAAVLAFATVLCDPGWPMTFPLSGMQSGHSING